MSVRYSENFLPSVAELHAAAAATLRTVERFRKDQGIPGLNLERLAGSGLWSIRVNKDIRIILGLLDGDWFVLHADHHAEAYAWADRHRLRVSTRTGSLQLVALAPTEIAPLTSVRTDRVAPSHVHVAAVTEGPATSQAHGQGPLAGEDSRYLEALGVPEEWTGPLQAAQTEDDVLTMLADLPVAARDRILELLVGQRPVPPEPASAWKDAEDTNRQFTEVPEDGVLEELLAAPLRRWLCFLHPTQDRLSRAVFGGPVKITGAAGTGKTTLALHRAAALARADKRVLVTTFSAELAENLSALASVLLQGDAAARQRLVVSTVHAQASDMCKRGVGPGVSLLGLDEAYAWLDEAAAGHPRALLLRAEWRQVVLPAAALSADEYVALDRTGRKTALSAGARRELWPIFGAIRARMQREARLDMHALARLARERIEAGSVDPNFDAVLADEAQDLAVPELRLLLAMAGQRRQLWLLGDGAQRIYQRGVSLKELGIPVVGRSFTLTLNYRTTERIRRFADAVLDGRPDDLGGGETAHARTRSLRLGQAPRLAGFSSRDAEVDAIAAWIREEAERGVALHEMCVVTRTDAGSMATELARRGVSAVFRTRNRAELDGKVRVLTMHGAKGLEYKVMFVARCEEGVWPIRAALGPQAEADERARELQLFHVACTRARDRLYVSWNGQRSQALPKG